MQAASSGGLTAQSQLKAAMALLEEALANGPILQKDVKQAAEANDISKATLRRARERLKIANKIVTGEKKTEYYWELPLNVAAMSKPVG